MSTFFDQLRVVGGGFLCGAIFMLIALTLQSLYPF